MSYFAGDIIGCIEVLIGLEEDRDRLFGENPYVCPPRPGDELNMAMFQVHMSRVTSLIDDLKSGLELYQYVISWKNPVLTIVSLYFFIRLVVVFDPAYIGSFPVFLVILFMIYLATVRSFGILKQKYIRKEIETSRKVRPYRLILCLVIS